MNRFEAILNIRKKLDDGGCSIGSWMQIPHSSIAESVDMNRVLEGMKVKMVPTKHKTYAVDTKEDLNKVEKLMKKLNDHII